MEIAFKDLTVEELSQGYIEEKENNLYRCVFCGETFEEGLIYTSRDRMVDAKRAAKEHVFDCHGGAFNAMLLLDKNINGLSEVQKNLLNCIYNDDDNKAISEKMGISGPTVRTHKYNLQKMKREAKIFLALMENLENEDVIKDRKQYEQEEVDIMQEIKKISEEFTGNTLHPFFTQCTFK